MKQRKVSELELVGYYLMNLATLGGAWFFKIIIKKAMIDAMNEDEEVRRYNASIYGLEAQTKK